MVDDNPDKRRIISMSGQEVTLNSPRCLKAQYNRPQSQGSAISAQRSSLNMMETQWRLFASYNQGLVYEQVEEGESI